MSGVIANVQISHPGPWTETPDYWGEGDGAPLLGMYRDLLGMAPINIGYQKLVHADGRLPEIGFEYSPEDAPPRWPDPDHPQQVHLDIEVGDVDEAERVVLAHGGHRLHIDDTHRVYADLVGHPFCLYEGGGAPGRIVRIVFDCFSPRALASFYAELLHMRTRLVDTPERVEIADGGHGVALAFQHSPAPPPRWPDPAYPAELHLDLAFEDASAPAQAEGLGAIRRPDPNRPDHLVYADPAAHPFCLGVGGPMFSGPSQGAQYAAWYASQR